MSFLHKSPPAPWKSYPFSEELDQKSIQPLAQGDDRKPVNAGLILKRKSGCLWDLYLAAVLRSVWGLNLHYLSGTEPQSAGLG